MTAIGEILGKKSESEHLTAGTTSRAGKGSKGDSARRPARLGGLKKA